MRAELPTREIKILQSLTLDGKYCEILTWTFIYLYYLLVDIGFKTLK